VSQYKFDGEQITSQGAEGSIGNTGAIAVWALQIYLGSRSTCLPAGRKAKNVTNK